MGLNKGYITPIPGHKNSSQIQVPMSLDFPFWCPLLELTDALQARRVSGEKQANEALLVELIMSPGRSLTMLFCLSLSQYFMEISKRQGLIFLQTLIN